METKKRERRQRNQQELKNVKSILQNSVRILTFFNSLLSNVHSLARTFVHFITRSMPCRLFTCLFSFSFYHLFISLLSIHSLIRLFILSLIQFLNVCLLARSFFCIITRTVPCCPFTRSFIRSSHHWFSSFSVNLLIHSFILSLI